MRLINTETLLLEEFHRDIPPYAILSHRWEEDEVVFADYPAQLAISSSGTRKKGFSKIELCAKQARLDGLSYCWVDTCCIDKSSSAELTEAINSMYAWYRDSAVCYIYLSDVDVSDQEDDKGKGKGKGKSPMPREDDPVRPRAIAPLLQVASSQWFKRGWTLQELLAPAICIFYDLGWVPLLKFGKRTTETESDRYGLGPNPRWSLETWPPDDRVQKTIEAVTGINLKRMMNFSPTSRDTEIATKMSWASKRKTTRPEDLAYSLMGIFDVNMPLLYGEGGVKAFLRLQQEIIKQSDDRSIFYWKNAHADHSSFRGLLASSPADFSHSRFPGFRGDPEYTRAKDTSPTSTHDKTFGLTNRGLRISLPILSSGYEWKENVIRGDDEELAILECGIQGAPKYGIVLARLSDDGHYARVGAYTLPYDIDSTFRSQPLVKEIFVRQSPVIPSGYKSSRMTAAKIDSDPAFRIISSYPEDAWDPKTRRLGPTDLYLTSVPRRRYIPVSVASESALPWCYLAVSRWSDEKYPHDKNKPLVTAVVRVTDLFPPGVPSIDFTISVRWKSRTEGDDGPYVINVQFDQVHYAGMATQTGWKIKPKSLVWTSSSGILQIGIEEEIMADEDKLVLRTFFTWKRQSAISARVDDGRRPVSSSRRLVSYVSSVRPS